MLAKLHKVIAFHYLAWFIKPGEVNNFFLLGKNEIALLSPKCKA